MDAEAVRQAVLYIDESLERHKMVIPGKKPVTVVMMIEDVWEALKELVIDDD